ncbi:MAG TPA: amidohydrolase family protein [Ktedonobacteraceae bacterium]|nr:amidohydrolase family protein [Ktedonobacteraceae bacterium]
MHTIAIEEHFLSDGFKEVIKREARHEGRWAASLTAERLSKLCDLGPARVEDMDAWGIDLQIISHLQLDLASLPVSDAVSLVRAANDQLAAAVKAHPDRYAGFALLPMTDPQTAVDELERAVRSLGFKGAMINGTTGGLFLDHPSFLPILERAAALDVPIYIHPAEPPAAVREAYYSGFDPAVNNSLATSGWGWHSEVGIHALRLILSGVFDRLPTLQIIIGHMGEMIPFMLTRINNALAPTAKNLQRRVPEYFLQNFYITISGFFADPLLLLTLQTVGADRIIFAVDYPFSKNEQGRIFLDRASISQADKEKISHLNAERLLKLT